MARESCQKDEQKPVLGAVFSAVVLGVHVVIALFMPDKNSSTAQPVRRVVCTPRCWGPPGLLTVPRGREIPALLSQALCGPRGSRRGAPKPSCVIPSALTLLGRFLAELSCSHCVISKGTGD